MTRIFLTLALVSSALLLSAFWLGWKIGDPTAREASVQGDVAWHFLTAVAAICSAVLVHALVLTYFMGTGRWLEETCRAYRLADSWQARSRELKWRLYPGMTASLLLLIAAGALGAAADPASAIGFQGFGGFTASQVHLAAVSLTLVFNLAINVLEFQALLRNGELVEEVMSEIRRMRLEQG
ncbi:MAG: hypothetical protein ACKV0T_04950, partial [Planctomycetales bacterium]